MDIWSGKFWQVVVSPEIATSMVFWTTVLSKNEFCGVLWAVCSDKAHCISLWGGSFHPDYANLGVLWGCCPSQIPFVIASATLPQQILDDVWLKLRFSCTAKIILHLWGITSCMSCAWMYSRVVLHLLSLLGKHHLKCEFASTCNLSTKYSACLFMQTILLLLFCDFVILLSLSYLIAWHDD